MLRPFRSRRGAGFTLVELLISVALIGVMAAVAVPSFISYQSRARRAEGMGNLRGMATVYTAFFTEAGFYPDMFEEASAGWLPDIPLADLSTTRTAWDSDTQDFFDLVGYTIEGKRVWHVYDITAPPSGSCACSNCFTITARGDTDGDGLPGLLMYVSPERDAAGNVVAECTDFTGAFNAPGGLYNEPAWHPLTDQY